MAARGEPEPATASAAPQRWVMCNQLDEDRDPTAGEWILHCERCGTGVYINPLFVEQGYHITCWWCVPPGTQVDIHPQMLAELGAAGHAPQAYLALGEIRQWLQHRANPRRHARSNRRKRDI